MKSTKTTISEVRWWDPLAALLLIVMLLTASMRLVATRWTEDLSLVQTVTVIGGCFGIALGYSKFSRRVVFVMGLVYTAFFVPWQLGAVYSSKVLWSERLDSISGRLEVIFNELLRRDPITDNILFLFLMAILFWVLALHAGYTLTRYGNAWRVITPLGLATFIIHTFDPLLIRRSWYLAFYLFFSLLLLARLVYLSKKQQWKMSRTHLPPDVGFDMNRFAVMITILLVLFAWTVPVLAESLQPAADIWQTTIRPWQTLKDRFSFAFASLRASVGLVSDYYGDSLFLGRGNTLSDRIIFEVETGSFSFVGSRFYWRAQTYDEYQDNQWQNNITGSREFTPDSLELAIPGKEARLSAGFTIRPYDAFSTLIVIPQPLWVSRPAEVFAESNPDGTVDVTSIKTDNYIRPGEQYSVRASLASITITEMRGGGTEYPQWVIDRYLQLPTDITPRTHELARRIAEGYDNPYDIADAVTNYLRENIEYSDTITDSLPDQERIDWFLFDFRKGFCNYYATAEVVMLRSLGIPARIAVGYAQGERQGEIVEVLLPGGEGSIPDTSIYDQVTYTVRQKDAHAWPEVFFPGIGWIEFEPTANQEPLTRPLGGNSNNNINTNEELADEQERASDERLSNLLAGLQDQTGPLEASTVSPVKTAVLSIILIGTLILLIILIWQTRRGFKLNLFIENITIHLPSKLEKGFIRLGLQPPNFIRSWAHYSNLPMLGRSYLEINRALKRLGNPGVINDTPAERGEKLISILPQTAEPTQKLLKEYQTATYSPHPGNLEIARRAGSEIRKLSILAKLQRIFVHFQEPPKENSWYEN
jgi:transglutaminase-like putative cysteine protease